MAPRRAWLLASPCVVCLLGAPLAASQMAIPRFVGGGDSYDYDSYDGTSYDGEDDAAEGAAQDTTKALVAPAPPIWKPSVRSSAAHTVHSPHRVHLLSVHC